MNDTILFSPIGGTDPISMNNCHDGAMLHICRVYKPTKIFLYMSQEMLKNQEADDRYRYALGKLFELQGRTDVKIIPIERPELQKDSRLQISAVNLQKLFVKLTERGEE